MSKRFVSEFLNLLENQRGFLKDLDSLTNEQLNFIPKGSKNSIGILLNHITGAEKFLLHQIVFGIEIDRDRDKEFEHVNRSLDKLKQEYLSTAEKTKELLTSKLEDGQLYEERKTRTSTRTVLWVLLHSLEHNNYHIGQIYLLLAMVKN